MTLAISSNVQQNRHDSTPPVITTSGVTNIGWVKVADWLYLPAVSSFDLEYPNRSKNPLILDLRNTKHGAGWTYTASISGSTTTGTYSRIGEAEGFGQGGYYATALDPDKCSIQATVNADTAGGSWISFQNGDSTIVHDLTSPFIPHCIQLAQLDIGTVLENGIVRANFKYEVGDTVMIELILGIVRYYLIKSDGTMILIRTTRSKLTADPKPEFGLYFAEESLSGITFMNNESAQTSLEVIGVLLNFQDWKNDFFISSTAEVLPMINGEPEYTFPNVKKRLRSLSASLAVRQKTERLAFEDFFNYHGNETEFLFVDYAKTDADGVPTEFWAKFGSPFGDKSLQSCLSSHTALITESFRLDYVPLQEDSRLLRTVLDSEGNVILDGSGNAVTILF